MRTTCWLSAAPGLRPAAALRTFPSGKVAVNLLLFSVCSLNKHGNLNKQFACDSHINCFGSSVKSSHLRESCVPGPG